MCSRGSNHALNRLGNLQPPPEMTRACDQIKARTHRPAYDDADANATTGIFDHTAIPAMMAAYNICNAIVEPIHK